MPDRLVRDPDGRVGRVDRLAPGARAAVDVDLQVVGIDLDLDLVGLGQHGDGRRRGVDAPLGLGLGNALDPVRPALELEHRIGAVALDREGEVAVADRERLDLEPAALGVAGQHPVQVTGPQCRFVAARAGPDLDDHVLVVVGIALDHRQADLLLELDHPGAPRTRPAPAARGRHRPRTAARVRPRDRPPHGGTRRRGGRPVRARGRRGWRPRIVRGRLSPRGPRARSRARRSGSEYWATRSSIIHASVGAARGSPRPAVARYTARRPATPPRRPQPASRQDPRTGQSSRGSPLGPCRPPGRPCPWRCRGAVNLAFALELLVPAQVPAPPP